MAELEAARYVRVVCGKKFLGSGFRLDQRRVLTCWHVVYGHLDGLQVQDPDGGGWQSTRATVLWPTPPPKAKKHDGLDAVLLQTEPQGSLPSWKRYQKTSISVGGRWSGAGYVPSGKKPEDRLPLEGTFPLVDQAEGGFTVSMQSGKPKEIDGWKGISGSPILTRAGGSGGLALVGLLRSAVSDFDGTLVKAVSIPALFRADGFEEALGLNKKDERWKRLQQGVKKHMDQEICSRLRDALGDRAGSTGKGPPHQELVDLVCGGLQLVDIATALSLAYGDDAGESTSELRSRIRNLVEHALPASFWKRLEPEVPYSDETRVRVRLLITDLVEVACAAIDGRSLRLEPSSVSPSGIQAPLQISLAPESGADPSGKQGAKDVTKVLAKKMALTGTWGDRPEDNRQALLFLTKAIPQSADHLFRSSLISDLEQVPDMNPQKWEKTFLEVVRSRIQEEAGRNRRYYMLAHPSELRERKGEPSADGGFEAVFDCLGRILPELRQVILEPVLEEITDENNTREALVKIFGKRSSREDDS